MTHVTVLIHIIDLMKDHFPESYSIVIIHMDFISSPNPFHFNWEIRFEFEMFSVPDQFIYSSESKLAVMTKLPCSFICGDQRSVHEVRIRCHSFDGLIKQFEDSVKILSVDV